MTPEACLSARGLLKWSVRELGEKSGVHWTTISAFENGRGLRKSSADKLEAAFRTAGVHVINEPDRTGAVLVYADKPDSAGPENMAPTPSDSDE